MSMTIQTTTVNASELETGMNMVIPERPDTFVSIIGEVYPSNLLPGTVAIETEVGTVYLEYSYEVLVEDPDWYPDKKSVLYAEGITVDAESIRAEIEEAAYIYDADENIVEKIRSLNDVEINEVIHMNVNDGFWEVHDSLKADVVRDLVEKYQD